MKISNEQTNELRWEKMLNLLNWEWVTVAHSTHTLLFYWFIRFLWSLKSLNVTKSKRRHDWQMPFHFHFIPSHFNLSQRESTARILCGKLVHILISALFCYFISFYFCFEKIFTNGKVDLMKLFDGTLFGQVLFKFFPKSRPIWLWFGKVSLHFISYF